MNGEAGRPAPEDRLGGRGGRVPTPTLAAPSPILGPARGRPALGLVAGISGVLAATAVLSVTEDPSTLLPGLLYLVPVVAAAIVGRFWPGLITAIAAATALAYSVLPPRHAFRVDGSSGLEALVLFVAVAVLVAQGAERVARSRAEAVAARDQLELVLAGGQLGAWSWDQGSGRVKWSSTMEAIFGFAPGEFDGGYDTFLARLHPADRGTVVASIERTVREGGTHHVVHRIVLPDGSVRWLEGYGRAVLDDRGRVTGLTGIAADVTDRRHLEEITDVAVAELSLEGLLRAVIDRVALLLGVDTVRIVLLSTGGTHLVPGLGIGLDPEPDLRIPIGRGFSGRIAAVRRPLVIEDVSAWPELISPGLDAARLASLAGVPLMAEDRLVGVLHVGSLTPRRFTEADVGMLQRAAARIAMSIERNRFLAAEVLARDRAERLQRITAALAAAATRDDVVVVLGRETATSLGAAASFAWTTHDGGLDAGAGTDATAGSAHARATALEAIETGAPAYRAGDNAAPRSWCDLPLVAPGGRALGVVGLDFADVHAFDRDERRFLETVAGISAEALQRAQLFESEQIARSRFEFLAELGDLLSRTLDRDGLVASVARAAVPRLADWCVLYVAEERDASGAVREPLVEVVHRDGNLAAATASLRRGYDTGAGIGAPAVVRSGRVEYHRIVTDATLDDATVDPETRSILRELGLRSTITVPLRSREVVFGALQLVDAGGARSFGPGDVAFAQTVGDRIGAALDNARLYALQREIAGTLQHALLPARIATIPGVDLAVRYWAAGPGTDVGGDFYDVFETGGGAWGIVVGDVCGKGPGAAAVTGVARHTLRTAARHGDGPAAALEWLNDAVREQDPERFCTVVYAELRPGGSDGKSCELTVAAAGHPLPLLRRADGSIEEVGVPAVPAGMFERVDATPATVALEEGDVVLLFTDGVTDLPPPRDLDTEELRSILEAAPDDSSEHVVRHLGDELTARVALADRVDDIALIALRIVPAGSDGVLEFELQPWESVTRARWSFEDWASARGLDAEVVEEMTLVVAELLANAVRAGPVGPVTLRAQVVEAAASVTPPPGSAAGAGVRTLTVEVANPVPAGGPWPDLDAAGLPADLLAEGGRGLHVVETLCDDVAVAVADGGTVVVSATRRLPGD